MIYWFRFAFVVVVVLVSAGLYEIGKALGPAICLAFTGGLLFMYGSVRIVHGFWPFDDFKDRR